MTPEEILEEVKSRFMVLYHNDQDALVRLLRQALGKFQDKAGVIMEVWQEENTFSLPPHFHAVAGCCDSKKRYISWRMDSALDKPAILAISSPKHTPPFCLCYFCDLRTWEMDKPLPADCCALAADYLEALIAVHNVKKERESYLLTGMNESAQTLPSEQELRQRISDLEKEMEASKVLIPPASIY